jgi:glycerol kinase
VLDWAHRIGLISSLSAEDLAECTRQAAEADPGDGSLCFIPAFAGIQTPIDDEGACASLIGWDDIEI